MRLMKVGPVGAERVCALVSDGWVVDLADVVDDVDARLWAGDLTALAATVEERRAAGLARPLGEERIGAPIGRPHQILCIGLNYAAHAVEAGFEPPDEPVVFTKSPNCLAGPFDDLVLPPGSARVDWEVELGVVLARPAYQLPDRAAAAAVIGGYVLVDDVSERGWQLDHGGQWCKGKSAPGFNPAGPVLVTADEVADVSNLRIWLEVDGERHQDSTTAAMMVDPIGLVLYLSRFFALEPGDLVNTGTPPGVGLGMDPPRYLQAGQVLRCGIDGLGEQRKTVVPAPEPGTDTRSTRRA